MKKRGLKKRFLALLLTFSIVASGTGISGINANAGMVTNIILGKWGAVAFEVIERSVLYGLNAAANNAESDALSSVFTWTKRILGGRQSIIAKDTLETVKKISAQLDALYSYTVRTNNEMLDKLNLLISNDEKEVFNQKLAVVSNFGSSYEGMLRAYSNLFNAFLDYENEQTEENKQKLSDAYYYVYNNYYNNIDTVSMFRDPLFGSTNEAGFLATISPYNQNQEISSEEDMTGGWNLRPDLGTTRSFLDAYYSYLLTVTNFENNIYDSISSASQIVANAAYLYLQSYRYYVELSCAMISSDASISDSQKNSRIKNIWNEFQDSANALLRGMNQMLSLYDGVEDSSYDKNFPNIFTGFMRSYDTAVDLKIRDYKSTDTFYNIFNGYEKDNGFEGDEDGINWYNSDVIYRHQKVTRSTVKITENQPVYQFRLATETGNGIAYAIRKTGDTPLYVQDVVNEYADYEDETTVVEMDAMQLLKGFDNGYQVISTITELGSLTSSVAYHNEGLITDYIKGELSATLGSDVSLPAVVPAAFSNEDDKQKKGLNFALLRSKIRWDDHDTLLKNDDLDMHMTWANVSMTYDPSLDVFLDLENDVKDHCDDEGDYLRDKEMVIFYKGTPSNAFKLEKGEHGAVVLLDKEGNELPDDSRIESGSEVTVRVKPDPGYTVDHISLIDASGNVLKDIIAESVFGDEGEDEVKIKAQEFLACNESDEEGYYEFKTSAPFQNASLQVVFTEEDPDLKDYSVTLHDYTEKEGEEIKTLALAQFGSYDYISEKNFHRGDTVVVSVTGCNDHISKGLIIKDKEGNPVNDVVVEDITDQNLRISPSERIYTFTMPEKDLDVEIEIGETCSVTVSDTEHISHTFEGLNNIEFYDADKTDWSKASSVSFTEGDTVTLSFEEAAGYCLSKIDVYNASSREMIPVKVTENGLTFTMPGVPVMVQLYEEASDIRRKLATIKTDSEDFSLNFLDAYGWPVNIKTLQADVGSIVRVKGSSDDLTKTVSDIVVMGKEKIYSADEISASFDKASGVLTFNMPSEDVIISAVLSDKETNDISDTETYILSPLKDLYYTGSERKQEVTLTSKEGVVLIEGRDYDTAYTDTVNIGTVTVTITGKNEYTGVRTASYRILDPGETYKVSVIDSEHISHTFKGLENIGFYSGQDIESLSKDPTLIFNPGNTVEVSFEAQAGYQPSRVDVYKTAERELIPCSVTENGLSFVMPSSAVTIQVSEERTDVRYPIASLDLSLEGVHMNFTDSNGNPLNVASCQVRAGGIVYGVLKCDDESLGISEVIIRDSAGNDLSFTELFGEINKVTGEFSFEMPSSNITVSATIGDKGDNDISNTKAFLISQPDDVIYNGREQKQPVTLSTVDGNILTEGSDYDIEYTDAVNIGTVKVTLTGKGDYAGVRTTSYEILCLTPEIKILENPSKVYDQKAVSEPAVSCDSEGTLSYSWYLYSDKGDLILLDNPPYDAGDYRVVVSVTANGSYGEGSAYLDFTISQATAILDLSAVQENNIAKVRGVVFGLLEEDGTVTFIITKDEYNEDSEETTETEITTKTVKVKYNGSYYLGVISGDDLPAGEYTVKAIYKSTSGNYTESSQTKIFTEGQHRNITVDEKYEKTYGDESFNLYPSTDGTNGADEWTYEIISDDFKAYTVGTSEVAAQKSIVVTDKGLVSVKHAGTAVIKITLKDNSNVEAVKKYYDTTAYVTVEVARAPLSVTSFALPSTAVEGELSEVTYGLRYTGLRNGDTRNNFTHGFGTLSPVPLREDLPASDKAYEIGITKNGVSVNLNGKVINNVFVSRDYELKFVYGLLAVIEESTGPVKEVKSAEFDVEELRLAPGESTALSLKITPEDYTNTSIIWKSEDEDVAVIDETGRVFAKEPGETILRAVVHTRTGKLSGVTKTASCRIYVNNRNIESVSLNMYEAELRRGESILLMASAAPENAEDAGITWKSSNSAIAVVSKGEVTAKNEGTVKITATAGDIEAVCTVTVKDDIALEDTTEGEKHSSQDELWAGAISDMTYTGEKLTPELRLYYGNRRLTEGTDYSLSWKDNLNAGTGHVTVSPKGNYAFSKVTYSFNINPAPLSGDLIVISPAVAETRQKKGVYEVQRLIPSVSFNGNSLKAGKDFSVTYEALTEDGIYQKSGTWPLTLTGKGNFTGTADSCEVLYNEGERSDLKKAVVRLKDGSSSEYTIDPADPTKAFTPEYELYYPSSKDGVSTEVLLQEGTDYLVSYSKNKKPGKAGVLFTSASEGAYFGSLSTSFKIKKAKKDISGDSDISVTFISGSSFEYKKSGVTPDIAVYDGDKLLSEGTDYTVSYKNNKEVSGKKTPVVIIRGKGYYTGKRTEEFSIVPADISKLTLSIPDFVYSDKAKAYEKVKLSLTDQDGKKLSNKDYMITGWDAVSDIPKPSTFVTVTIAAKDVSSKGSGNYTGTITGSFRIIDQAKSIQSAKLSIPGKSYTGLPLTLSKEDLTVTLKQDKKLITLEYGTDYEIVSYQNNTKPGKARVTIRGTGDYAGVAEGTFKIEKAR